MNKPFSEGYSSLRDDVRTFIVNLHHHIKGKNIIEIENDTQIRFPKLTEQYFMTTRWPSVDIIAQIVDDKLFLMLYNELYYRHIYAHVSTGLTVEDRIQSYLNYAALFDTLLKAEQPIDLVLPNQWLWDIIDEFLYQFQKFCSYRNRLKLKPEDEAQLLKSPTVWSIHSVLNVLHSFVAKSNINEQLSYYANEGDPDDIADEFGRCVLYKMLGFFSLIGLCRLHCLLGDYYTAIKVLKNIKLNRFEMYHEVPTCHITTGYYVGFSFMMMRSYQNAVSTLQSTLSYKSRAIGLLSQRADLKEYVNKQADQMMSLLAICLTMIPTSDDYNVDLDRREKFVETVNRLQQLDETEFASSFDLGCPKFVSPETPYYAKLSLTMDSISPLEPQRQQIDLFKTEITQQIELLRLRSYLKLYTNISASKLANFMNVSEPALHMQLMAYKYRLKQAMNQIDTVGDVNDIQASINPDFNSSHQMHPHLDFYVDGSTIYVADTIVDRRFSEFFILQVEQLQQLNKTLDTLERRIHEANVQETIDTNQLQY
ncbi:Eukaryotic translation initiation factor 3 subunit L [Schistosoma japonicum]|nr:Eukaryotic translation initiation factor 3 subunit L [Schistosoma japonicum]KAH8857466.1 Eukaryotic translation initiation factor 3 subunit L [Schistosoma japonicum]